MSESSSIIGNDECLSGIPDDSEHANEILSISKNLNPSCKKSKTESWRNSFLSSFHWLRYNTTNQTAHCSFKKCEMYYPISKSIIDIELGKQHLRLDYSVNMKRRKGINSNRISLH